MKMNDRQLAIEEKRIYHVEISQREVDKSGILLEEKVVLGEAVHVKDQVARELSDAILLPLVRRGDKLSRLSVKLLEQSEERLLRNDGALVLLTGEEGRRRDLEREEHEGLLLGCNRRHIVLLHFDLAHNLHLTLEKIFIRLTGTAILGWKGDNLEALGDNARAALRRSA